MYNTVCKRENRFLFFVDGLINLIGKSNVRCTGYTNLCSDGGNADFRLDINVTACPAAAATATTTGTTTTTRPTTTPRRTCICSPWTNTTPCTATCGASTRQQSRTCTTCSPIMPVLVRTVPCQVLVSLYTLLWSSFQFCCFSVASQSCCDASLLVRSCYCRLRASVLNKLKITRNISTIL